MKTDKFRSQFHHITTIDIRWGDMDSLGHVNNALYFRYFEMARIHYFEKLDYGVPLNLNAVGPILAKITCDFKKPLTYPDQILVGSNVYEIGNTSMKMRHTIYSVDQADIAAIGDSVIVNFDYATQQKVPISGHLRQRFQDFEQQD